jgi:hypothetical protein
MRLRGPLVITSALGLAVLAVSVVAVWASISRVRAIEAIAVTTTFAVGVDTFAPPPGSCVSDRASNRSNSPFTAR